MVSWVRNRVLVPLVLGSLAVLAACGSEETAQRPEAEPSARESASPSAGPVTRTEEAKAVLRDALRR